MATRKTLLTSASCCRLAMSCLCRSESPLPPPLPLVCWPFADPSSAAATAAGACWRLLPLVGLRGRLSRVAEPTGLSGGSGAEAGGKKAAAGSGSAGALPPPTSESIAPDDEGDMLLALPPRRSAERSGCTRAVP